MTAPSIEKQHAVSRLKQGDLGGLEALVRRYKVCAVYAAYLIVRDMDSAEDLVQEIFLHAVEKIDQLDAERSFFPWFMRSVVNVSIKSAGTESTTDASGKTVEKKKCELVTIHVLGKDYIVNIWGEKRGERYYADVIFLTRSTPGRFSLSKRGNPTGLGIARSGVTTQGGGHEKVSHHPKCQRHGNVAQDGRKIGPVW